MKNWYQQTGKEVLAQLDTTDQGLTERQIQQRRKQYGPNALKETGRKPA